MTGWARVAGSACAALIVGCTGDLEPVPRHGSASGSPSQTAEARGAPPKGSAEDAPPSDTDLGDSDAPPPSASALGSTPEGSPPVRSPSSSENPGASSVTPTVLHPESDLESESEAEPGAVPRSDARGAQSELAERCADLTQARCAAHRACGWTADGCAPAPPPR